jgi:hypothetical protein
MTYDNFKTEVELAVSQAIQRQITIIKNDIIEKAKTEFTEEIQKLVGDVALSVVKMYSIEHIGGELLIHVKIMDNQK